MAALRIALLIIDGVTLAEVTPIRERLNVLGTQATIIVPTGGPILPVSGRYYAAASGNVPRRALCQLTSGEIDLLLLPDGITGERLARHPEVLALVRGRQAEGPAQAVPVFTIRYLIHLLDQGLDLSHFREEALTGCT